MESYLEAAKGLARRWDEARPRTQQTEIGWSGMADCRAYLGYQLAGAWPTDEPDKWRPIAGTVLHDHWWAGLRKAECERLGVPASFGVEVSYGGIKGHVDEVLWPTEPGGRWEVTDWKFPTLSSIRLWGDDAFLNELFVQPHGYAAGILELDRIPVDVAAPMEARYPVISDLDPDACIVRLHGMPVSAKSMDDWACHERPFSRQVADDALARLDSVRRAHQEEGVPLGAPELRDKPFFFCEKWCEMFTACRGGEEPKELELITDPELAAAVNAYGLANELIAANKKILAELRPDLDGARGRTGDGFRIWHGRGNPGKVEFDGAAVEAVLGARGIPLTDVQRHTPDGRPKLYVKRS
jgi:hypothetical protein